MSEAGVQPVPTSLQDLASRFWFPIRRRPPGTRASTWVPRRPAGRGSMGGVRPVGEAGPTPGAPKASRALRPDADVSFPSHYTSRHYLLGCPGSPAPDLARHRKSAFSALPGARQPFGDQRAGLRKQGAYWLEVRQALGANWPEGGGALARLRGE